MKNKMSDSQLSREQVDQKKNQIANELMFSFWLLPIGFFLGVALCFSPLFFWLLNIEPAMLKYVYGLLDEQQLRNMVFLERWRFTEREIAHLNDVRSVVQSSLITGGFMALIAYAWYKMLKPNLYYSAIHLNGLIFALVLIQGIVGAVNFKFLSDLWHSMLFPAGSWSFPKHAYVMTQLYPFWVMKIGAIIILASGLIFALSLFYIGRKNKNA